LGIDETANDVGWIIGRVERDSFGILAVKMLVTRLLLIKILRSPIPEFCRDIHLFSHQSTAI